VAARDLATQGYHAETTFFRIRKSPLGGRQMGVRTGIGRMIAMLPLPSPPNPDAYNTI
jgi:hypothetical protein